jgi:hypothetical protein
MRHCNGCGKFTAGNTACRACKSVGVPESLARKLPPRKAAPLPPRGAPDAAYRCATAAQVTHTATDLWLPLAEAWRDAGHPLEELVALVERNRGRITPRFGWAVLSGMNGRSMPRA